MRGIDLIGDIHGHANELHRLLKAMDYKEINGSYQHVERTVVFLGDFIDRGPDQLEVLRVVTSMTRQGHAQAIMGNHEYNALGWATPDGNGGYLRAHNETHRKQHQSFLDQINEGSSLHRAALEWFRSLPILLDLPGLRAIHACWHLPSILDLADCLDDNGCFTISGFVASHIKGSAYNKAVEVLLKGPEIDLPAGVHFYDKEGTRRTEARIRWWNRSATTLKSAAIGVGSASISLPDKNIDCSPFHYFENIPIFFGHYWLSGNPKIEAENALCLDYSVAKGGELVGYRWDDTTDLHPSRLIVAR
jgi:hypothetical protein